MCNFQSRKWTLFSLCLIGIVVTIGIVILIVYLINLAEPDFNKKPDEWKHAKVKLL